jgi:hypothetical protein
MSVPRVPPTVSSIASESPARSAVAHAGIGISPARRSLAKGDYQWGTGWKVNAAVHKTASPKTFRDWGTDSLAKPAAKAPLQLISNSQSRRYSRWFPAGPAP